MSEELSDYLVQAYRRDILGESVGLKMPQPDPKLIEEIKTELARIDALRLGANLVNRDFASYQNKRALERLLTQLEAQQAEPPQEG